MFPHDLLVMVHGREEARLRGIPSTELRIDECQTGVLLQATRASEMQLAAGDEHGASCRMMGTQVCCCRKTNHRESRLGAGKAFRILNGCVSQGGCVLVMMGTESHYPLGRLRSIDLSERC